MDHNKGRRGVSYLRSRALLLRALAKVALESVVRGYICDTRFVCSHGRWV
jgi:hypothetical protein